MYQCIVYALAICLPHEKRHGNVSRNTVTGYVQVLKFDA